MREQQLALLFENEDEASDPKSLQLLQRSYKLKNARPAEHAEDVDADNSTVEANSETMPIKNITLVRAKDLFELSTEELSIEELEIVSKGIEPARWSWLAFLLLMVVPIVIAAISCHVSFEDDDDLRLQACPPKAIRDSYIVDRIFKRRDLGMEEGKAISALQHGDTGDWLTLTAFALHSLCNQFMYSSFPVPEITMETFDIDLGGLSWIYTSSPATSVLFILFTMRWIDDMNWSVSFFGVMGSFVGGWLRLASVQYRSYALVVLSNIAQGAGQGVIYACFAELPYRCFPKKEERAIATAIAMQSAMFGYAMGLLIVPLMATSMSSLEAFWWVQAFALSLTLAIFLAGHRSDKAVHCETDIIFESGQRTEQRKEGRSTLKCLSFALQVLALGLLEGAGFTVPIAQQHVTEEEGYNHVCIAFFGFSYIMGGVLLGLTLGKVTSRIENQACVVLGFFWAAAAATWILSSLSELVSGSHRFALELAITIVAGGCSLGIVNVALPLAVSLFPDAPPSLPSGFVAILAVASSALLTIESAKRDLSICAVATIFAASLSSVSVAISSKLAA